MLNKKTKANEVLEEYCFLTDQLEEVDWALKGDCNDIDCDRYVYKDLLKKKYKPTLEHDFSCTERLQREKAALMRVLSLNRYDKVRHEKCNVCEKRVDKLSNRSTIVSYTKPKGKYLEWKGHWCHKKCEKNFKIPTGWKKN